MSVFITTVPPHSLDPGFFGFHCIDFSASVSRRLTDDARLTLFCKLSLFLMILSITFFITRLLMNEISLSIIHNTLRASELATDFDPCATATPNSGMRTPVRMVKREGTKMMNLAYLISMRSPSAM